MQKRAMQCGREEASGRSGRAMACCRRTLLLSSGSHALPNVTHTSDADVVACHILVGGVCLELIHVEVHLKQLLDTQALCATVGHIGIATLKGDGDGCA